MKKPIRLFAGLSALGLALAATSPLHAGPFILAGTDADEHGHVSGGVNQDGWFFMQRALENLAPAVTNGNKHVVFLGTNPSTTAGNAALSAFNLSTLATVNGWTSEFINDAAVNTFLAGGLSGAGIIMMDSAFNVSGGANGTELGYFTTHANQINSFLGAGGGLFSQSNGYGWVSALVPGLTAPGESSTGIALTPSGSAAFPGLTNADLSAGPYHNRFANFGSIPVLGTSTSTQNAIILGASGGTVTNPDPVGVPDGGSLLAVYLGVAGMMFGFRRHFVKRAA